MNGLIGYTGFVGTSLMTQTQFDKHYNSKNIESIRGEKFESVICAGAPAVKWKANQEPEQDLSNIQRLIENLSHVETEKFILISTVDVYSNPIGVTEDTIINVISTSAYGKHRLYLEQFVSENFPNYLIVRLPGLFGNGLKKNFIYDLLYDNCLHLTHRESQFQFYDMSRLWKDLQKAVAADLSHVNFSPEPTTAEEIALECFGVRFMNETSTSPVKYDMKSNFVSLYNPNESYMYTKEQVFDQLRQYIRSQKR